MHTQAGLHVPRSSRPAFKKRRLVEHILQALGATASSGALLFGAASANAQTVVVPGGSTPYSLVVTGTPGPLGPGNSKNPQAGGQGGTTAPVNATLATGLALNATVPAINLSVTGGVGGSGNEAEGGDSSIYGAGAYGGAGGTGGAAGLLSLTITGGVAANTTAPGAVMLSSQGGIGGFGGAYPNNYGYAGTAGFGGRGGDINFTLSNGGVQSTSAWNGSTPGSTAVLITSFGGAGAGTDPSNGNSGTARQSSGKVEGRAGGNGGRGGDIGLTIGSADILSGGSGLTALTQGGNGSAGSDAYADFAGDATGGRGGDAGDGGNITLNVTGSSQRIITAVGASTSATGATLPVSADGSVTAQAAFLAAGVQLQSFGGEGGVGGGVDGAVTKGGNGGNAGSGGTIGVNYSAMSLSTTGFAAAGIVAQSVGGSGGDGASPGGVLSKKGGNGGLGGNGGAITLDLGDTLNTSTPALVQTAGNGSAAIVAQSIGGGGGYGGDVSVDSVLAGVGVGGSGESGGTAATVTVLNGEQVDQNGKPTNQGLIVKTTGSQSAGIVAQSIGGGGGFGGNAADTVFGPFAYSVGGTGGKGGSAGTLGTTQVSVSNEGIVQTGGDHSMGIVAQAIGGGGGIGGSASSLTASGQLNVTVSVGGDGGTGGNAGDVVVTNDGQIITMGNDASGVLAQSIGGGGGDGGASKAYAIQVANSGEAPSLNFSLSLGGKGADAGNAGNVTATNIFAIMTSGNGSHGMEVQSIGGGGGNGGDSSSIQSNVMGSTFNYNMAIGGSGGAGGTGGAVTATNSGLIWTMGWFSYGVLAQSIGGGGGNGGNGNTDTSSFHAASTDKSAEFSMALGGSGGSGNVGGTVTLTNDAGIITQGDLSRGLFAQSVGGGGGNGGGAVGNGTGGNVSVNIGIGGNGGSGNDAGMVTVTNNGAVYTKGAESAGIYAQSVGGGGGSGGSGAAGGGVDPEVRFGDYLANSVGLSSKLQGYGNNIYGWKDNTHGDFDAIDKFQEYVNDYEASNGEAKPPADGDGGGSFDVTLDVGAAKGGKGGSGGNGAIVNVTSYGAITTVGPASDGIFAQSVGGGGGDGGTAIASNNPTNGPKNLTATISVGGGGGSSGNGAAVLVTNDGGQIQTSGDQSHGIFAQSLGGGGGSGGYTATGQGSVHDLSIQLGGDAGASGNGSGVYVRNVSDTPAMTSTITTAGADSVGIVAESIGGGGGNVGIMHTEQDPDTGGAVSHSEQVNTKGFQGTLGSVGFAGTLSTLNCNKWIVAACGDGALVSVTSDTINTSGVNAYGVLAQSIGGGGGWVAGGTLSGNSFFDAFVNGVAAQGDGSHVDVTITHGVTTSGNGAIGVLAQSIGGAGLLAGDTSTGGAATTAFSQPTGYQSQGNVGNGGEVDVTLNAGATITTAGKNAHGIFAQSVGGGGGLVTTQDQGTILGSIGGVGTAGPIDITVNGSITTTGANASGVFVNAAGGSVSTNPVTITVNGTVSAGSATNLANAITIISNSNSNSVTNNGTITAVNAAGFAVAAPTIGATSSPVTVLNNAGATINGNVDTAGGTFTNNGTWSTTFINNANVINNGTMIVGGNIQSQLNPVVLNGTLKTTGTVSTAADFTMQQATQLVVNGEATVSGKLHVTPYNIAPQAVAVLTSLKTLSLGSLSVTDDSNGLYTYKAAQVGNSLQITPQGNFSAIAKQDGLGRGAQSLAEHLETSFNASTPVLQGTFNYLAKVATTAGLKSTLDTLSNETVQSVGTSRLTASQAFVDRMNSCPQFGDNGVELNERDCAWTRAVDNRVHRDDTNEAAGYSQQNHAMQFGGQKGIGGDWFLGASFAYDTSSTNGSNSNTTGNGWAAGLMLKRQLGEWLFSGSVDGGSGHYNTERQVMLGAVSADAKASFTGQNFGVHGRVARQFSMSNWYVKPYVDLHATRIQTGAYTETNGGAYDLAVNAQHDNLFAASTMVEVGSRFELRSNMALRTYVSGGMTDYSKNEWSADARLAGASDAAASFDSVSTLPKHRATIGAGVNLLVGDKVDVKLEYTGEMAAGYRSNTASAKVSYLF